MYLPSKISILIGLFLLFSSTILSQNKSIHIRIRDEQAKIGDTMYVQIWDNILANPNHSPYRLFKSSAVSVFYEFSIPDVNDMGRISVSKVKTENGVFLPFVNQYLVQSGDEIIVNTGLITPTNKFYKTINDSVMNAETLPDISFSGKGADKYNCQRDFILRGKIVEDSIFRINARFFPLKDSLDYRKYQLESVTSLKQVVDRVHYVQSAQKRVLSTYSDKLSPFVISILEKDILGAGSAVIARAYREMFIHAGKYSTSNYRDSLHSALKSIYLSNTDSVSFLSDNSIQYSINYIEFLVNNAIAREDLSYDQSLRFINNHYSKEIKEKLLTSFFLMGYFKNLKNQKGSLLFALENTKKQKYLDILTNIQNRQTVGHLAIDFQLPDINNRTVKLSDFKGKVVFLDFWFTGCTGCSQYYESDVSVAEEIFKDFSNVVFVTICVDQDKETWKRSVAKKIYTSELAVNLFTDGKGVMHPVVENYLITAYPRPILIGKDGNIFSNSSKELRSNNKGVALIESIRRALKQ